MHVRNLAASKYSVNISSYNYIVVMVTTTRLGTIVSGDFPIQGLSFSPWPHWWSDRGIESAFLLITVPHGSRIVLTWVFPMFGVQKFITEQPGNVNSFLSPPLLCFDNCSQAQVEYQGPVEDKGDHKTLPHPQPSLISGQCLNLHYWLSEIFN